MKKFRKIVAYTVAIGLLILIGLILFSPFKKQDGRIDPFLKCSIDIHVPVDSVFRYLGNSDNARNWSSFVDHITPVNSEEFKDGTIGSIRRCFVQEDELGMRWDEEIIEIETLKKRKLSIFNLKDFPIEASGLASEQIYTKLNDSIVNLSFTLFFDTESPNLYTLMKMKIGSYRVKYIFDKNLERIKRICETNAVLSE